MVNYDFDHDTFYRVENNGQHEPTYFNGSPLKHFRPNVTGHNYLNRKVNHILCSQINWVRASTLAPVPETPFKHKKPSMIFILCVLSIRAQKA